MRRVRYTLPASFYSNFSFSRNEKYFADSCWKKYIIYSASWSQKLVDSQIKWRH